MQLCKECNGFMDEDWGCCECRCPDGYDSPGITRTSVTSYLVKSGWELEKSESYSQSEGCIETWSIENHDYLLKLDWMAQDYTLQSITSFLDSVSRAVKHVAAAEKINCEQAALKLANK